MQQDKLRDFLKFFRFHLPWFVLSAGFFAVILLTGLFFSSRMARFMQRNDHSSKGEISLSVPEEKLAEKSPEVLVKTASPAPKEVLSSPLSTAVPVVTPRPVVSPKPPVVAPAPKVETKSTPQAEYTVKSGDTLWDISVKNYGTGYDYSRISRTNKLANANKLTIGQKLILPERQPGKIASGVSTDTGDTSAHSTTTYKIVKGDSLWKIAQQQLGDPYRWTELYQLNQAAIGKNPDLIYPDVLLDLPAPAKSSTLPSSSMTEPTGWSSSLLQ